MRFQILVRFINLPRLYSEISRSRTSYWFSLRAIKVCHKPQSSMFHTLKKANTRNLWEVLSLGCSLWARNLVNRWGHLKASTPIHMSTHHNFHLGYPLGLSLESENLIKWTVYNKIWIGSSVLCKRGSLGKVNFGDFPSRLVGVYCVIICWWNSGASIGVVIAFSKAFFRFEKWQGKSYSTLFFCLLFASCQGIRFVWKPIGFCRTSISV